MYAFPPTSTSHTARHAAKSSHETVNSNHQHHNNNNNNNNHYHHHHRDSSIDKDASLGEWSIFANHEWSLRTLRKKKGNRRDKKARKSANQITLRLGRSVMIRRNKREKKKKKRNMHQNKNNEDERKKERSERRVDDTCTSK